MDFPAYKAAFRDGWNGALEEAARLMERESVDYDPDDLYTGRAHRAAAIRSLKNKD